MNSLVRLFTIACSLLLLLSCSLFKEEEPDCDNPGRIDDKCYPAVVSLHTSNETPDGVEETFHVNIHTYTVSISSFGDVHNGTTLTRVYTTLEEGRTYTNEITSPFASVGGGQIADRGEVTVKLTKLDRANKLISAEFSYKGTGEANFSSFNLEFTGHFVDLSFD